MSQKDFDELNALCADFGEYMSGYASKHGLDNVGVKEYSFEAFGEPVSYDVNYADSDETALIWVIGDETDEDIFVRKINGALFDVQALESLLPELDVHLPYVESYYQN